ncbi:MAG TPA: hypothetical protein VFQ65_23255 [Kofleriaceae bacterium]|nr:hypothetical protein [Kofleriaceae bacterium]
MVTAHDLMTSFAERTGLTGSRPQRRYLWTDAFAVCNFLGLGEVELALRLVDRVHGELGRHRPDDPRRGWISGLAELEGAAHPTLGGLRIGKPLAERAPGEPSDDRLEWDRDGQYFHYLTKWMHALARTAGVTGNAKLAIWASELAVTAHRRFVYELRGKRRMYWKMSVDLLRPQVASMGQHDPLDGYITCLELDATAARPELRGAAADFRTMIDPSSLATIDPLGIGGLLVDAHRLARLDRDHELCATLVRAAHIGLERYVAQAELRMSADHRLAFRELGLAIGLAAADAMDAAELAPFVALHGAITSFWADPVRRRSPTYRAHEDINDVMLATSLEPEGFLSVLAGPPHPERSGDLSSASPLAPSRE